MKLGFCYFLQAHKEKEISEISECFINKDENVHRYAVRGKKRKSEKSEREKERTKDRDREIERGR